MKIRSHTAIGWFAARLLARIQFDGAAEYPQPKDAEAKSNG